MSTLETVVVNVDVITLKRPNDDVIVARLPELGLTAYGLSAQDAEENVKRLFNRFIHGHRDAGTLESVLDRAGVDWFKREEYPSDQPAYEDTNLLFGDHIDLGPAIRNNRLNMVSEIKSRNLVSSQISIRRSWC